MKYKVGDYILVKPELHCKYDTTSFCGNVCGKVVKIIEIIDNDYPYIVKDYREHYDNLLWDGDIEWLVVGNRIIKESE